MALTESEIQECTKRYVREFDRYTKMSEVVYQKCQEIVQKKLTVRATIQRRTKNPVSLTDKLRKPRYREKYNSVDDVFENISDLAGVRIATYLDSDRDSVVEQIRKEFVGKEGQEPEIDRKDRDDLTKYYRATHCQVYLPEEDLSGVNENLRGTTCEIQVCSILAYVFNEIEHDLQYKPLSGEISEAEKEYIDQLGLLTKAGELTIKRLLAETDERLSQRTGKFNDVYDFVARMQKVFSQDISFAINAGQLFDELIALGIYTPEQIHSVICPNDENIQEVTLSEFDKLNRFVKEINPDLLEPKSSDILLAGILKYRYADILQSHPMAGGTGRPSRLVQIAELYKQLVETT